MLMDTKQQLITHKRISIGGISEATVDIRQILREALLCGASGIILAHNHPSGNPTPSQQDNNLTKSLDEACRLMRIKLIDHIIVGDNDYYSYYEHVKQ